MEDGRRPKGNFFACAIWHIIRLLLDTKRHSTSSAFDQQLMSSTLFGFGFLVFGFSGFWICLWVSYFLFFFVYFLGVKVLARLAAEPNARGNKNVAIKEKLNCNKAPLGRGECRWKSEKVDERLGTGMWRGQLCKSRENKKSFRVVQGLNNLPCLLVRLNPILQTFTCPTVGWMDAVRQGLSESQMLSAWDRWRHIK